MMTEKRFKLSMMSRYGHYIGISDKDKEYTSDEVVDLLNKLSEENEQLKSEYKVLHTQYQDLKKFVENNFDEYLTQEKLNKQIIKLSNENEQLKQQLLENTCDNCIYSKAIYADVECRKKGLTKWECNCDEFKGDVE